MPWGYTTLQVAVLALAAGSSVLGLFIAGLAGRAVLRSGSRQMLYLGLGMVLLFGVAYGISIAGYLLLELGYLAVGDHDPFRLGVRVTQFAGLLCIAYSLWIGSRPGASLDS